MTKKLKIISINSNSWNANKASIMEMIRNNDPDVVLIQDHSLTGDQRLKIWNYNVVQQNKTNQMHDGCAIAIRKNLTYRSHDDFDEEMLAIDIATSKGKIRIATAYQPPRRPYILRTDFRKLFQEGLPTFLLADLNARHRENGNGNQNLNGKILSRMIRQGICERLGPDFPTYFTRATATSPDVVLANIGPRPNHWISPLPATSADHIPIQMILSWSPIQIPTKPRNKWANADWDKYRTEINNNLIVQDLSSATPEEIDSAIESWIEALNTASREAIPTTAYRTLPHPRRSHDDRVRDIRLEAIRSYFSRGLRSHQMWTMWKDLKREALQAAKDAMNETWNRRISALDQEMVPKKFWGLIRKLQGTDNKNTDFMYDSQRHKKYEDGDIEIILRRYWSRIYTETREPAELNHAAQTIERVDEVVNLRAGPWENADSGRLNDPQNGSAISLEEIKNTLKTMKQKSPGLDGITKLQIAKVNLRTIEALVHYLNASLSCGYYPKPFKAAKMILIPKSGKNLHEHTSYRPISLLSVVGKLFGKLLNRRLVGHLTRTDKFNPCQHGFRPQLGTQTALAVLWEAIVAAKERQALIAVTSRDVEKAFDRVWHRGAKFKILNLELPVTEERIMCSYLDNRTARIEYKTVLGPEFPLECGVPQGGSLSPTYYSIFTHDIPEPVYPWSLDIYFADDIAQIIRATSMGELKHVWNSETTRINNYEKDWFIKSNPNKFQVLPIGSDIRSLKAQNVDYHTSSKSKILGLTIGKRGLHRQVTANKASAMAQLQKLQRFKGLSTMNKKKLYTMLMRSKLIYPSVPLHAVNGTQLQKMQVVQNKGLNFVIGPQSRFMTTKEKHESLSLSPINVVLHEQAIKVWRKIEEKIPNDILNRISMPGVQRNPVQNILFPSSREAVRRRVLPRYCTTDPRWQ